MERVKRERALAKRSLDQLKWWKYSDHCLQMVSASVDFDVRRQIKGSILEVKDISSRPVRNRDENS